MAAIDINDRFRDALHLMAETGKSLFITGKAGTGKSTLLTHFCRNSKKRPIVLAPTGVAALNVGGQTIHSFFNFQIDITLQKVLKKKKPRNAKLYQRLKTIIIDEVSMVRADLLDCVEAFLRKHGPKPGMPFGGVQMVFIGDLYQLPPVVTSQEREIFRDHYKTPYFFSAHALQDFPLDIIELEKVYRQKDKRFVELLNRVRNNSVTPQDIDLLNSRYNAREDKEFAIHLTTTNQRADTINHERLMALKGKLYHAPADIKGDFGREYYPTSTDLSFKIGAQIMMLNNDKDGRWVNGSLGVIKDIEQGVDGEDYVLVRLHDEKQTVEVIPHTWEVYRFSLAGNEIMAESAGTFTQYPFRLAWAVTIHKSQGKTFERVAIDLGTGTFAGGQMYVALSRCTSFEGITMKTHVKPQHIRTDPRIYAFMTGHQVRKAEEALPKNDKIALIERAIRNKALVDMVYLKGNDSKTTRTVRPLTLAEESFKGKKFLGMKAFCTLRKEERMFSVDRILEIKEG